MGRQAPAAARSAAHAISIMVDYVRLGRGAVVWRAADLGTCSRQKRRAGELNVAAAQKRLLQGRQAVLPTIESVASVTSITSVASVASVTRRARSAPPTRPPRQYNDYYNAILLSSCSRLPEDPLRQQAVACSHSIK